MQKRPPDSELTAFAAQYVLEHKIKAKIVCSHCRRFEALVGVRPIAEITGEHVAEYRKRAHKAGLSIHTVEKLLIDVRTVIKAATGVMLWNGRPAKRVIQETKLMKAAETYILDGGLQSRMIVSNCRKFFNLVGDQFGDIDPKDITKEHIVAARRAGLARTPKPLSRYTIETSITDVMTIVRSVTGVLPDAGRRLRRARPAPRPVPLETVSKVFNVGSPWLRQWLVLVSWTGARLANSMRIQKMLQTSCMDSAEFLSFQASKTGRNHLFALPDWFRPWLKPVDLPFGAINEHSARVVRKLLAASCETAGVELFTPKQLRQRAITQWARANGAAGAIIHGKSLGVMDSYVVHSELLQETAPRVVMPDVFKPKCPDGCTGIAETTATSNAELITLLAGLDESTKSAMVQMMRRMTGKIA